MYKYLLFDLDGTVTDSQEGIIKSVQYALESFGIIEENLDILKKFLGPPLRVSFAEYYNFTPEQAEQAIIKYRERFSKVGLFENSVYSGVEEMLKNLKNKGYILAVATSKPQIYAKIILDEFDLSKYFKVIVGSELNGIRDNKGEVIAEVLKQLCIDDKKQVVMIGDRKYDIAGAKQNNIDSIGVKYGYARGNELEEAGADYIINSVNELEKFF